MAVRSKVCKRHVLVNVEECLVQVLERLAVKALAESIHRLADDVVVLVLVSRVVAGSAQAVDLGRRHAEEDDVVVAHCVVNFHVRAVQRAEGDGAVDHKLHVGGAGSLCTRKGDLFADLRRRGEQLCPGYAVVFNEDDAQLLVDARVVVDGIGKADDELENFFCEIVARGCLCAEEERVRGIIRVRVFEQPLVYGENMQRIHVLALVLVQTLDLYVENAVWVNDLALRALNVLGKALLVVQLDLGKLLLHGGIVLIFHQLLKLSSIVDEAVARQLGDKGSKLRVRLVQPAAMCNAVCDVLKFIRPLGVEVVEHAVLQNFAVQRGNAVRAVCCVYGKVCHAHIAVVQRGHAPDLAFVHALCTHLNPEAAVDLFYNLVNTRQTGFEQVCAPALKRLAHNGVVRVRNGAGHNIPSCVPLVAAFVEHDAHEFRDGEHGVCVIEVDRRKLRQIIKGAVRVQVAAYDVLYGGGNEEVLLCKAQALALVVVIFRIEDLCDGLCHSFLLHSAHIVAAVEELHIKFVGFRTPDAQHGNALAVHAGNIQIVRDRHNGVIVLMTYGMVVVMPLLFNVAVEVHLNGAFVDLLHPDLAARKPEVRQLRLPTLNELLAENTVFIAQGIAHGRVALCCKAVKEAGGKTAEAAVAKAGVRLLFVKVIELYAHFGKCFAEAVLETEVKQVVLQGAAQQELHAQVVDLLCLLLFSFVYKFVAAANEQVAHHKCGCFVEFIVGSVLCGNAVNVRELLTDCALDLRGGHLVIHSLSSMCYA